MAAAAESASFEEEHVPNKKPRKGKPKILGQNKADGE